jgi:flavin reductase (DIM6/NTAB) family NADH-FMN oxidoreductase RutF
VTRRVFTLADLERIDRSKLLTGLVVPRPIGWIGTSGPSGDNLAPYSFFNLVVTTPPTLLFCPGRSQRDNDTLINVLDTGQFTVSIVTEPLLEAMNASSAEVGQGVDEFELAGVGKAYGREVGAPFVFEAAAAFECRVIDVHDLGEGPAVSVVYGEILTVHVEDEVLDGTRIRFDRLGAVGRLAGPWYSRTVDRIEIERPSD